MVVMVLSSEHSYGRKRHKYRTCTFPMDRWGPTETCSKSIDVCIYEILAIEELSEIRYFIPLSKEISAEFIDEQELQLTRFEIVEAIVNMLRFYIGEKTKM